MSVDVWKAIWSDSKNILNVAGKKRAPGEVPSTSESILTTLLLLQKIAVNQVRVHFPTLVSPDLARLVRLVIVLRSDRDKNDGKGAFRRFGTSWDIVMENRDVFLDEVDEISE